MSGLKFVSELSHRDKVMLNRAADIAKFSKEGIFRHGAIVMKNGHPVGVGVNSFRNSVHSVTDPQTEADVHAEVAALKNCGKTDVRGATIYVARINRRGQQRMSKPCKNCQKILKKHGIRKVFYTVEKYMEI